MGRIDLRGPCGCGVFLDCSAQCHSSRLGGIPRRRAASWSPPPHGLPALDLAGVAFSTSATRQRGLGDQSLQRRLRSRSHGPRGGAFFEFHPMDARRADHSLARAEFHRLGEYGAALRIQRLDVVAGRDRGGLHAACSADRDVSGLPLRLAPAAGESGAADDAVFPVGAVLQQPPTQRGAGAAPASGSVAGAPRNFLGPRYRVGHHSVARLSRVRDPVRGNAGAENGDPAVLLRGGGVRSARGFKKISGRVALGCVFAICRRSRPSPLRLHAAGLLNQPAHELGLHADSGGFLFFLQPLAIRRESLGTKPPLAWETHGHFGPCQNARRGTRQPDENGPSRASSRVGWIFLVEAGDEFYATRCSGLLRGAGCGIEAARCGSEDLDLSPRDRVRSCGDPAARGGWGLDRQCRLVAANALPHLHKSRLCVAGRAGICRGRPLAFCSCAEIGVDALRASRIADVAVVFQLRILQPAGALVRVGVWPRHVEGPAEGQRGAGRHRSRPLRPDLHDSRRELPGCRREARSELRPARSLHHHPKRRGRAALPKIYRRPLRS